ncbi:hypothetical protein FOA52_013027 [Chlamydomonas sp. UWO 241]|nr:hypothetical protein FOA52_013027 [Chlamydomonas sp. UWO 241]
MIHSVGQSWAGFREGARLKGCLCYPELLDQVIGLAEGQALAKQFGINRAFIVGILQECSTPFSGGTGAATCPSAEVPAPAPQETPAPQDMPAPEMPAPEEMPPPPPPPKEEQPKQEEKKPPGPPPVRIDQVIPTLAEKPAAVAAAVAAAIKATPAAEAATSIASEKAAAAAAVAAGLKDAVAGGWSSDGKDGGSGGGDGGGGWRPGALLDKAAKAVKSGTHPLADASVSDLRNWKAGDGLAAWREDRGW